MFVFNPSYKEDLLKQIDSVDEIEPKGFQVELNFVDFLIQNSDSESSTAIFLYRHCLENTQFMLYDAFRDFCERDFETKLILDFTMIALDPHLHLNRELYNFENPIYECFKNKIGLSDIERDALLDLYFRDCGIWTHLLAERLRDQSSADKVFQLVEYPFLTKEIFLKKGVNVNALRGVEWIWTPFDIPSYFSTHYEMLGYSDQKSKFLLTGTATPFYPVRFILSNLQSELIDIRKKPVDLFNGQMFLQDFDFESEHRSYIRNLNEYKFSLCGPSILQVTQSKFYESMYARSIVVTPKFDGMELRGLVDGVTCIAFDPLGDIESQLHDIVVNSENLEFIRDNAWTFLKNQRSFEATLDKLLSSVENELA